MTSNAPLFRVPAAGGDNDQTSDANIDPALRERMLRSFADNNIEDTPENRKDFIETEELKEAFHQRGVPYQRIAPTRDGQGHVRLDYDAAWDLLHPKPKAKGD